MASLSHEKVFCELEKLQHIEQLDGMPTSAVVVSDIGIDNCFSDWWRRFRIEALLAKQAINGTGVEGGKIFTARIGPMIRLAAGDIDGTRRDAGQQHVLIHRQVVFIAHEFPGVTAKPVGETRHHFSERLAGRASPECGARTARLRGDCHCKPLILRRSP